MLGHCCHPFVCIYFPKYTPMHICICLYIPPFVARFPRKIPSASVALKCSRFCCWWRCPENREVKNSAATWTPAKEFCFVLVCVVLSCWCFGFVFFPCNEFIQTHSVTRAVCWLPDQSHLNMQKVRTECSRNDSSTPAELTISSTIMRKMRRAFSFHPPRRRGRRAVVVVGWLGGSWGKVVAPPQIACKLVKVWIYVRNIVCSCFAHIRTNTRKTRQNDLAAYANWSQLADWHLIQAVHYLWLSCATPFLPF